MTLPAFHTCPAPKCRQRVQRHRLACEKHWFQLPGDLRTAIWEAWRAKDLAVHRILTGRAITLWIQTPKRRAEMIARGDYLDDVDPKDVCL